MFQNNIHTRVRYVFLITLILFIFIIVRVFYIQVFKYDDLNKLAQSLWSRNLPITADRGVITDRNGKELATNITTNIITTIKTIYLFFILA